MSEPTAFTGHLAQKQGYQFAASFRQPQRGVPDILLDEPGPLSAGEGPNASQVLAVAVGNWLTASLLICAPEFTAFRHPLPARWRSAP